MKIGKQLIISRLAMAIVMLSSRVSQLEAFDSFMLFSKFGPIIAPMKSEFSIEDVPDCESKQMEDSNEHLPTMFDNKMGQEGDNWPPMASPLKGMMDNHLRYEEHENAAQVLFDLRDHYDSDNMGQQQQQQQTKMGELEPSKEKGKSGQYEEDSDYADWQAWKNILTNHQEHQQKKESPKRKPSGLEWSSHYGGQQKIDCEPETTPEPMRRIIPRPKPTSTSTTTTTTTRAPAKTPVRTTTEAPIIQQQIITQAPVETPVQVIEQIQQTTEAPTKIEQKQQQKQQIIEEPGQTKDISDTKFSFYKRNRMPLSQPIMMQIDDQVFNQPEEKTNDHDHKKGGHNQLMVKGDNYQQMMKDGFSQVVQDDYQKTKGIFEQQMKKEEVDHAKEHDYHQEQQQQIEDEKTQQEKDGHGKGYEGQQRVDDDEQSSWKDDDHGQMKKGDHAQQMEDAYGGLAAGVEYEPTKGAYDQIQIEGHQGGQKKVLAMVGGQSMEGAEYGAGQNAKGGIMQQMKDAYGEMMIKGQEAEQMKVGHNNKVGSRGNEIQHTMDEGHSIKGGHTEVSTTPTKGGDEQQGQQQQQSEKGSDGFSQMMDTFGIRLKGIDGQQMKEGGRHQKNLNGYNQMTKGGRMQQAKGGLKQQHQQIKEAFGDKMIAKGGYSPGHTKGGQHKGEIHQQQQQTKGHEELPIKGETMIHKKGGEKQAQILINQVQDEIKPSFMKHSFSNVIETTASQRARNSFLNAADIARHLTASGKLNVTSHSGTTRQIGTAESISNGTIAASMGSNSSVGQLSSHGRETGPTTQLYGNESMEASFNLAPSVRRRSDGTESSQLVAAKYLGLGDLQKYEGNNRTQARLSCQFSEPNLGNVSILNVEWNRFEGDYSLEQQPPPFECQKEKSCQLVPIRTDTLTTIHPRPFMQNYADGLAPSYSLTLHEVDENHTGKYRCSATRLWEGKKEVVYRIISLE